MTEEGRIKGLKASVYARRRKARKQGPKYTSGGPVRITSPDGPVRVEKAKKGYFVPDYLGYQSNRPQIADEGRP